MSPNILVCLTDGSEEMEAVTIIDLLSRAEISVTTSSCKTNNELIVNCSRGVKIVTDIQFNKIIKKNFDAIVLPGGLKAAKSLRDNHIVIEKIRQSHLQGKIIAAMCSIPAIVLEYHNIFPTGKMSGYPALQNKIAIHKRVNSRVYYDDLVKLLTSQGPATAIDFSLKLIEILVGKQKATEVATQLILPLGIYNYAN